MKMSCKTLLLIFGLALLLAAVSVDGAKIRKHKGKKKHYTKPRGKVHRRVSPNNVWAARCASRGSRCDRRVARRSRVCAARVVTSSQSRACLAQACAFCQLNARRRKLYLCRRMTIVKNCFGGKKKRKTKKAKKQMKKKAKKAKKEMKKKKKEKKEMKKEKKEEKKEMKEEKKEEKKEVKKEKKEKKKKKERFPSLPDSVPLPKNCIFKGKNGMLNIPATKLPYKYPWVRRGSYIEWKPEGGPWIDPPGTGLACVQMTVDVPGQYYLTLRSAGLMRGEHNDVWVYFSAGVILYRPSRRSILNPHGEDDRSFKAYHPKAKHEVTDEIFTKDHNPHQFITKPLATGTKYTVCIAGRSTKFRVYAIKFLACRGSIEACSYWRPEVKEAVATMPKAKCHRKEGKEYI